MTCFFYLILYFPILMQGSSDDISQTEWRLISYSDPFTGDIVEFEDNVCNSSVMIKFESKNRFIATLDHKWSFHGKYRTEGQNTIRIIVKINEKVYLPRAACASSKPSTFALKIMLGGIDRFGLKNDTLRLLGPLKNGDLGALIFVRNK